MPKVTLYTKTVCPYCTRAKSLLRQLGAQYEEVNLDHDPDLRDRLSQQYSWRTVPMVVVGERFLGGYDDIAELHSRGELEPILKGTGAGVSP